MRFTVTPEAAGDRPLLTARWRFAVTFPDTITGLSFANGPPFATGPPFAITLAADVDGLRFAAGVSAWRPCALTWRAATIGLPLTATPFGVALATITGRRFGTPWCSAATFTVACGGLRLDFDKGDAARGGASPLS